MKIWQIIFLLVFMVSHKVQTQLRQVKNTTCLELAKPSNQKFRLSCSQYDYHCLLDDTFTQEFEVCREWKWIPGGKCAYFNTYGNGNVDERECTPGINLTCSKSKHQFESRTNTQFTACYAKRESVTSLSTTTSPIQVTFNGTSERDTATSFSFAWIIFLFYIIAGLLSFLAVLSFIRPFSRKDDTGKKQIRDEEMVAACKLCSCSLCGEEEEFEDAVEFLILPNIERQGVDEKGKTLGSRSDSVRMDNEKEDKEISPNDMQENLLRSNPPTDDTVKRQKGDQGKSTGSTLDSGKIDGTNDNEKEKKVPITDIERQGVDEKGKTLGSRSDSVRMYNEKEDKEISPNDMQENLLRSNPPTDDTVKRQEGDQGKSTGSTLDSGFNPVKIDGTNDNDNESSKITMESLEKKVPITEKSSESTSCSEDVQVISDNDGVFGDDLESLQRKSSVTIDQPEDKEHYEGLYYFLNEGSMTIIQKILTATITKITEKSAEESLDDESNCEKLKEVLDEEFHSIIKSKDRASSIDVLYGLHRIFLDKKAHPKSGWGNPIRNKDTGIGDDVERLHRIRNIVREISNPVNLSIENYMRLFDIMIEALSRLDGDDKFSKDLTDLTKEIACYKKCS